MIPYAAVLALGILIGLYLRRGDYGHGLNRGLSAAEDLRGDAYDAGMLEGSRIAQKVKS